MIPVIVANKVDQILPKTITNNDAARKDGAKSNANGVNNTAGITLIKYITGCRISRALSFNPISTPSASEMINDITIAGILN